MKRLLIIPVIAVLALVGGVAYGAWNGGADGSDEAVSSVPSEGIDVHGDWKIAIYNADGSLDREYAFSNALLSSAGEALGIALSPSPQGNHRRIHWIVVAGELAQPSQSPCSIGISAAPNGSNWPANTSNLCFFDSRFAFLSVNQLNEGLRLDGSIDASGNGTIDYVETWMLMSNEDGTTSTFAFTGTDVGPFEDIQEGQAIDIQVDITFQTPSP
jgi:hypothetical protein